MAKTSVAPKPTGAAVSPKVGPKAKVMPEPNVELVRIYQEYNEHVEKAESCFVQFAEFILEHELDRATVVVSIAKARGISYETADQQYSRMKKLLNNEEVLQELKDGKITLRAAREKTKTPQKNPKSSRPEAKEQKYNSTLKAFGSAAKESGYSLKEILMGVEAELKSSGIK